MKIQLTLDVPNVISTQDREDLKKSLKDLRASKGATLCRFEMLAELEYAEVLAVDEVPA